MITTIDRRELALTEIEPHPLNRHFPTTGEAWDEFEDDVAAHGIREDLMVRVLPGGGFQCLRGHRRRFAGVKRGVKRAWCQVVAGEDEEAFDAMWGENLFRENANPADEARAVAAMLGEFGKTVEELAKKWKRSVEWIRTRQGLLLLGDEVMEAVARPGRDRLSVGAVEEILKVPAEFRGQAVQLVLHPELELGTLDENQARDVLRRCLLEPKAKEAAWEGQRKKLGQAWRKELEKLCLKGTKGDLMIQTKSFAEAEGFSRGYVAAEQLIDLARVLPDAPHDLRWLHLAVKHSLAVLIVPDEGNVTGSRAVVSERILVDAESAAAEHGEEHWIAVGKRNSERGTRNAEEEQRVEKAEADLAAGFDTGVDVAEKPETVIEQSVERHAMINFGKVRNLALWAVSTDSDPQQAPEWVPKWAVAMAMEGNWTGIDAVTDWVMGLKI